MFYILKSIWILPWIKFPISVLVILSLNNVLLNNYENMVQEDDEREEEDDDLKNGELMLFGFSFSTNKKSQCLKLLICKE